MKLYLKILSISILAICISCSNNSEEIPLPMGEMPDIPNNIEIDIDDDGSIDFEVKYSEVLIESTVTDGGIVGRFNPIGENEILINREEKSLFLRDLSMIENVASAPLSWESKSYRSTIVSISNNIQGGWPSKWDVESKTEQESYFLGLKIKINNETQLAWCEFEINARDGNVLIVNKGIL